LKAAVAYYGSQPRKGVEKINAAMLLHYASNDRGRTRRLKKYNDALKGASGFSPTALHYIRGAISSSLRQKHSQFHRS
ncbi:MAG: hypothetical protein ACE1ZY_07580, partial [Alphaproteobacteria bacterium]